MFSPPPTWIIVLAAWPIWGAFALALILRLLDRRATDKRRSQPQS